MTEELKPEEINPVLAEQISQELVKGNVTEAVIASLREKYLPLSIDGSEDKKETYLIVKEGRKECKSIRVLASKICKKGRESAVKIQKAWVKTEERVTGQISEVEDYLEAQEKAYDKKIAEEKEARKRNEEEQLILRQQILTGYGALYSEGGFTLGEVTFELSVIKESEEDIWLDAIWPKYEEEYKKIRAEQIEQERKKKESEDELKRQQKELEQKKAELAEMAVKLKEESDRQLAEAEAKRNTQTKSRQSQVGSLGFKYNGSVEYNFHEFTILHDDLLGYTDEEWSALIGSATEYVDTFNKEIAAAKKLAQERKDLQQSRLESLMPYAIKGAPFTDLDLGGCTEDEFQFLFTNVKSLYEKAEEEKAKHIAEAAAKKERERIEEEQRQADHKTRQELRNRRKDALLQYNYVFTALEGDLADLTDTQWFNLVTEAKDTHDEKIRKQEEERKAEELAKSGDKIKWEQIAYNINTLCTSVENLPMRSSQYRKKAAILREKLEEIKSL